MSNFSGRQTIAIGAAALVVGAAIGKLTSDPSHLTLPDSPIQQLSMRQFGNEFKNGILEDLSRTGKPIMLTGQVKWTHGDPTVKKDVLFLVDGTSATHSPALPLQVTSEQANWFYKINYHATVGHDEKMMSFQVLGTVTKVENGYNFVPSNFSPIESAGEQKLAAERTSSTSKKENL